jgi:hypothetical protein
VAVLAAGCVPAGNAGEQDAGKTGPASASAPRPTPTFTPSVDVMKAPFEDDFDRPNTPASPAASASATASAATGDASSAVPTAGGELGPDWMTTSSGAWRIENGRLCGEHAKNHGVWLKRTLPVDARIEFDAISDSPDGDLKAEYWGDGHSAATAISYTNATSYLTIFGGWHNKFHVLARLDEHAADRKEIPVDPTSDDPRERPVVAGQRYHFKVERTDGRVVRWWIDGVEMLTYPDQAPLVGVGHDHFGFNDWEVRVCFDSVRVVPLP